jgi:hypothetical protein
VNGTGFVSTSVVKWNGSARSTTFVTSSQLKASISSSDVASAGSATVTVNSGTADSNPVSLWITTPKSSIGFTTHPILRASAPSDVLTADFNSDFKTDYALANVQLPNLVGISLGKGNGNFQPSVNYKTAPLTVGVAAGDFNADGKLDLAVSGQLTQFVSSSWAVWILLGNGDGTFTHGARYSANFRGGSRALIADFNRDGNLDIAAIDADSTGYIGVMLGNGDGTFQPIVTTAAFGEFTAIGDFNGDGVLDLVGTDTGGPAFIALGNGDGTFQTPTKLTSGGVADSVAVADFDGDGKMDVAFDGLSPQVLSVCLGNGDGTFQPCMTFPDYPSGNPSLLQVVDLNGDGKLDVIAARGGAGVYSYLFGTGDGTFQSYNSIPITPVSPGTFAIGYINGDGRPDAVFIAGSSNDNDLGVYRMLQNP